MNTEDTEVQTERVLKDILLENLIHGCRFLDRCRDYTFGHNYVKNYPNIRITNQFCLGSAQC